jgi:hypothetical protein
MSADTTDLSTLDGGSNNEDTAREEALDALRKKLRRARQSLIQKGTLVAIILAIVAQILLWMVLLMPLVAFFYIGMWVGHLLAVRSKFGAISRKLTGARRSRANWNLRLMYLLAATMGYGFFFTPFAGVIVVPLVFAGITEAQYRYLEHSIRLEKKKRGPATWETALLVVQVLMILFFTGSFFLTILIGGVALGILSVVIGPLMGMLGLGAEEAVAPVEGLLYLKEWLRF